MQYYSSNTLEIKYNTPCKNGQKRAKNTDDSIHSSSFSLPALFPLRYLSRPSETQQEAILADIFPLLNDKAAKLRGAKHEPSPWKRKESTNINIAATAATAAANSSSPRPYERPRPSAAMSSLATAITTRASRASTTLAGMASAAAVAVAVAAAGGATAAAALAGGAGEGPSVSANRGHAAPTPGQSHARHPSQGKLKGASAPSAVASAVGVVAIWTSRGQRAQSSRSLLAADATSGGRRTTVATAGAAAGTVAGTAAGSGGGALIGA